MAAVFRRWVARSRCIACISSSFESCERLDIPSHSMPFLLPHKCFRPSDSGFERLQSRLCRETRSDGLATRLQRRIHRHSPNPRVVSDKTRLPQIDTLNLFVRSNKQWVGILRSGLIICTEAAPLLPSGGEMDLVQRG